MAGRLIVFEAGDQFATIATSGRTFVWQVFPDGIARIDSGNFELASLEEEDRYDDRGPYPDDHD